MARRKKNFIVVAIKGDKLVCQELGEDVEDASDILLHYDDGKALLFDGLHVPFKVKREPTIVIGASAAAPKKKAPSSRKKKPSTNGSSGTRFDADTLEPVPAPAPEQQTDVEA